MAAVAMETTTGVRLTRDAVVALVNEARNELENGASELYTSDDESQRPTIAASVEIIGRLASLIDQPWRWPRKETPVGPDFELADGRVKGIDRLLEAIAA